MPTTNDKKNQVSTEKKERKKNNRKETKTIRKTTSMSAPAA
jgi:hypothetical protein